MLPKQVTIKYIAEKANVSIATVSNVINGKGRVSEKTAERVRSVIQQYRYQGNIAAKNLRTKKSYLFGVVVSVTQPERRLKDNPFYWELISGVEAEASDYEFAIALKGIDSAEELSAFITQRDLDGVIIVGAEEDSSFVKVAEEANIPAVYIDSYFEDVNLYQVRNEDEKGAASAAKHLLDLGHRKIALLSGKLTRNSVNYFRWQGCKKELSAFNCYDESLLIETDTSAEGGYHAADDIIGKFPEVTAVISFSDITALGLYKRLDEKGYDIPRDLSITGFDGVYFTNYMIPKLTTVKQDVSDKGVTAVNLLFAQIQNNAWPVENRRISLPVHLIDGNSTAPCKIL
ncbi:LacI family DNA-binding transcriptional regulator [Halobacillus sp. K22]|uniref:LacI family DNA-binding transcriptional regulator n=1 Tax=Halobacillus sp. K22 TaxID=3457431 RepID=UPI003FCDA500